MPTDSRWTAVLETDFPRVLFTLRAGGPKSAKAAALRYARTAFPMLDPSTRCWVREDSPDPQGCILFDLEGSWLREIVGLDPSLAGPGASGSPTRPTSPFDRCTHTHTIVGRCRLIQGHSPVKHLGEGRRHGIMTAALWGGDRRPIWLTSRGESSVLAHLGYRAWQ